MTNSAFLSPPALSHFTTATNRQTDISSYRYPKMDIRMLCQSLQLLPTCVSPTTLPPGHTNNPDLAQYGGD